MKNSKNLRLIIILIAVVVMIGVGVTVAVVQNQPPPSNPVDSYSPPADTVVAETTVAPTTAEVPTTQLPKEQQWSEEVELTNEDGYTVAVSFRVVAKPTAIIDTTKGKPGYVEVSVSPPNAEFRIRNTTMGKEIPGNKMGTIEVYALYPDIFQYVSSTYSGTYWVYGRRIIWLDDGKKFQSTVKLALFNRLAAMGVAETKVVNGDSVNSDVLTLVADKAEKFAKAIANPIGYALVRPHHEYGATEAEALASSIVGSAHDSSPGYGREEPASQAGGDIVLQTVFVD
ncbi:MAG: hypothetical protein LBN05_00595 [Oscillospiraceae bacterium]|nr:hypothetical protein [Oscillospiraceae bacterium]